MLNAAFVINNIRNQERAELKNIMKQINYPLNENESNNYQNESDLPVRKLKLKHVLKFIKMINDGSDVLNSRFFYTRRNKLKCAYRINLNEQNVALSKLFDSC